MLVFDFDGTLTLAEEEGAPFTEGYLDDLALLTGGNREEIGRLAARFASEIGPNDGWIFRGQIVAPACVDPYLRIMPVARRILDHYGRFMDPRDREALLDRILHKYNYGKTAIAFRDGAFGLLNDLPRTTTWVVTNSATEPVQRKITDLGFRALQDAGVTQMSAAMNPLGWLKERVVGSAKKYENDPDWSDVVEPEMRIPGLDRPVLLRRRLYYETLDRLRREAGVDWDGVTVVGDIFELDLALLLALGGRGVLMANSFTPPYEIVYLENHERAHVVYNVSDLREYLGLERY